MVISAAATGLRPGEWIALEWRTIDRDRLTGILLTQRAMTSPEPPQVVADFWSAAGAARRRE